MPPRPAFVMRDVWNALSKAIRLEHDSGKNEGRWSRATIVSLERLFVIMMRWSDCLAGRPRSQVVPRQLVCISCATGDSHQGVPSQMLCFEVVIPHSCMASEQDLQQQVADGQKAMEKASF